MWGVTDRCRTGRACGARGSIEPLSVSRAMAGSPASPRAPPAGAADASRDAEVAGETGAAYPRFETFQPAGADWSLKDFAWDSTRSVAVSREHLSRSAGGKRVAEDEAGAPIDPGWLPGKARDAKATGPKVWT